MTAAVQLAEMGNAPSFRANPSYGTAQTVSNTVATKIACFTSVDWDTHSGFNTSTNTYTVPISGYYLINAFASGSVNSGALGFTLNVFVNGAGSFAGSGIDINANTTASLNISYVMKLAAGATVNLYGTVYSGAATLTIPANAQFELTMIRGL